MWPVLVTLYQTSLEPCVYFWAFLSHAVMSLGGAPVCESGRPRCAHPTNSWSSWVGKRSPAGGHPWCGVSMGDRRSPPDSAVSPWESLTFPAVEIHWLHFLSSSFKRSSSTMPAGARCLGRPSKIRQCCPCPHGPHSLENYSDCLWLPVRVLSSCSLTPWRQVSPHSRWWHRGLVR